MNGTGAKGLVAIFAGVGGYLLDCLSEIIIILAILMILDYILGVTVSLFAGQWNKDKGIRGLTKKIGYMVCVAIGFLLDYIIMWLTEKAGVSFNTGGFFGIAVTCYLIGTEGISLLSHLVVLGVPVPPFLQKAFKKLINTSETISGEGKDPEPDKQDEDIK